MYATINVCRKMHCMYVVLSEHVRTGECSDKLNVWIIEAEPTPHSLYLVACHDRQHLHIIMHKIELLEHLKATGAVSHLSCFRKQAEGSIVQVLVHPQYLTILIHILCTR